MIEEKILDTKAMRIRHSLAHIMAQAVLEEFPEARLGTGPALENGFYYDFELPRAITDADLKIIQKRMKKIIGRGEVFEKYVVPIAEAKKKLKESGQTLKIEIVESLEERGVTDVSFYKTGEGFEDLCEGPHVENTKEIPIDAFKLDKFSAAYWRADENRESMQRIYGIAFESKDELVEFQKMREEAKKRNHRKLGKELELFTIIDEVGAGLPLFYPKGTILRRLVENLIEELQEKRGYLPIWIPHITKSKLYEISGHLDKYDAMYPPMHLDKEEDYYLKPMNCPHFMMLYKTQHHSYRDLPLRYVSTTTNYRYEKSGELTGLTRVRSLTQDDCHVFTTPELIGAEINLMLDMIEEVYTIFGFTDFYVSISTRDPEDKEKYIGEDAAWDAMETTLKGLIKDRKWQHEIVSGEAAFYGPKLDFMFKDVLGREWQLSTIQLDMNLPERFELEYVNEDGTKQTPVVIHRAILGSVERFLGILIEHFGGAFPTWLAPIQVQVLPIAEPHEDYATAVVAQLRGKGIRAEVVHSGSETLNKRIRTAEKLKIPYMLVVGDKEAAAESVAVRSYKTKEQTIEVVDAFITRLGEEIASRAL